MSTNKIFKTINYEGTTGWQAKNIKTNLDGSSYTDIASDISKYSSSIDYDLPGVSSFNKKENKYLAYLKNNSPIGENEIVFGNQVSGIKGQYTSLFLETYVPVSDRPETDKKELFAVSTEAVLSSN